MFTAQTEWTVPDTFPDLSKYSYVAIDLETRDPNLKSRGSGAVIGEGAIIGVALAVDKDSTARIDERSDKGYATQVYYSAAFGSTRMEEAKVVDVQAHEA